MEVEIIGYYLMSKVVANPDGSTNETYQHLLDEGVMLDQLENPDGTTYWDDAQDPNDMSDRKIWGTLEEAQKEIQRLINLPKHRLEPDDDLPGAITLDGEMEQASGYGYATSSGTTRFMIMPVVRAKVPIYEQDFTFVCEYFPSNEETK